MRIFVGHLSRDITNDARRQAFEPFGKVDVRDAVSTESKGFGFVEMPAKAEAQAAVAATNGQRTGSERERSPSAAAKTGRWRRTAGSASPLITSGRGRGAPGGVRRRGSSSDLPAPLRPRPA